MSIGTQQTLQRYARPLFVSSATNDKDVPFAFRDWYSSFQGVIPGQEYKQYNEYLTDWYKNRAQETVDPKIQLRLNYLTLLKQLQLFFTKEEAENWYNNVDISNDKELLLAIPYFAKKLKDIALYYLQLRNTIKESRLKYNQSGTSSGIVQQLQKYILNNYTQKPNFSVSLPSSIWKNVPELSSVKDTITIQIEELYDAKQYLDHSPTVPVSSYYDVNNFDLANFLTTKGLALTSTEWIYKLGVAPLSANYINLSGEDLTLLSQQIAEKYLGEDKFITTTPILSTRTDFLSVPIFEGNNFFYWPGNTYHSKAKTLPRYNPISINESGLLTVATPGTGVEVADTVFVKTPRGIEGAWYRYNLYENKKNVEMSAELFANKTTTFRFPFPGYGLSGEGIPWTGFSTSTTPQFFYLEPEYQQSIEDVYWSTSNLLLTSCKSVKINDTTLVDSKAYSNRDFNRADKINVWFAPPKYSQQVFSGLQNDAWLYRFDKTDISLSGSSVVVWPYESIDPNNDFPDYYPENFAKVCSPVPVSAINFSKAIAGNALSSSDVIYKLSNYKDAPEQALECCWLSGAPIIYPSTKIITTTPGELQFVAYPDNYTKFIWNGEDFTDASTVFKTYKHQPDCKFINEQNLTKETTYLDFNLCTCKQTLFTPFGHPGVSYDENNQFADFIIENNFDPDKNIDLSIWKDTNGANYTQSEQFGWYKTNSKIGWGDGTWFTGSSATNNTFYLRTGKSYIYYRTPVKTQDKTTTVLPEYVVRYSYNSTNQIWIQAFKNKNNEWITTNQPAATVLYPGNILLYKRALNTTYSLSGTTQQDIDISENRGSIWTSFDYMSVGLDKTFVLSYPFFTYTNVDYLNNSNPVYPQYPALNFNNLVSVLQWSVSAPNQPLQLYRDVPSVIINPVVPGIYTFGVTAVSASGQVQVSVSGTTFFYRNTGLYIFDSIPPLTAIENRITVPSLTAYLTPAPGYVLNTPLRGWDYNRSQQNVYAEAANAGARPYWARAYNDKDETTGYKSVITWGTPTRVVDKYNFITQPELSRIVLDSGNKISYTRNNPINLVWKQPIDFTAVINKSEWCTLNVDTTGISNLQDQLNNYKTKLITYPTTSTSNLLFQSFVDNEPVEIFYNAVQSFTWNVTATPEITQTIFQEPDVTVGIKTNQPWANLSNQTYPTVASFPGFDELYSASDVGGYFTPNNLGASIYTDQDYTASLNLSSSVLQNYFNGIETGYNNRGLTKQDQLTPYNNYNENNIWLKEPTVTGSIAGTIKKTVFKKYQKFLPYQSSYESNPRQKLGLLTPQSRQTPWGGKDDLEWKDSQNKPTTFTGVVNTNVWAQSQVLKQAGLQIDNWLTDIFGNQYGLYKNLNNVTPYNRKQTTGEIWVRKNSQLVQPAYLSMSRVFDTYTGTNLINELTGTGIRKIDLFFDTLLVETSGTVIFERLNYDYNTDTIFSIADEARYLSLTIPVSTNLNKEFANENLSTYTFSKAGETWFLPEQKLLIQSVCGLSGNNILPELYQLDINSQILKKIFPIVNSDITNIKSLSSLNLISIEPPTLSHNALKKEYLLTIFGKNNINKNTIIEMSIKDVPTKILNDITVYSSFEESTILDSPAIIHPLIVNIEITNLDFLDALIFQCTAENGPVTFEKVSGPAWIGLSPSGLFSGTPPLATTSYNTNFKVTNSVGPTYYSLIVNVNYTQIQTYYYLYTEGYILSGGDDFILQEDGDRIFD